MNKEIKLYHFFAWSSYYGWEDKGCPSGYSSIEKCKRACDFYIKGDEKWKIMKLEEARR